MIHATRRRAASLLVILALAAAGCSRGGSGDPTEKGMLGRANNSGKYGVNHLPGTKLAKGQWSCKETLDGKAKTVTTDCTGKTTDGKPVKLQGVSTYAELKKKATRALPGKFTITVGGVVKATPTCVGQAC